MGVFRATFFFEDTYKHGWTETVHHEGPDLTVTMEEAKKLLPYRVDLLGGSAYLTYIRCSDDAVKRDSVIYQVPARDSTSRLSNGDADIANTCLIVRMDANPLTRRTLYLRGIPDNVISSSGNYLPTTVFRTSFDEYKRALLRGQWKCKSRIGVNPDKTITSITQNTTNGQVTITTQNEHGFEIGQQIVLKGLTGCPQLNGQTTVLTSVDASTFKVNCRVLLPAWTGAGKVSKLGYTLATINNAQVIRTSHRISGRPFDSPRGRRSAARRR